MSCCICPRWVSGLCFFHTSLENSCSKHDATFSRFQSDSGVSGSASSTCMNVCSLSIRDADSIEDSCFLWGSTLGADCIIPTGSALLHLSRISAIDSTQQTRRWAWKEAEAHVGQVTCPRPLAAKWGSLG